MKTDEYFMQLARVAADTSEEPSTHVGCVIVDKNDEVVSVGCNNYVAKRGSEYMTDEKPMRYLLSIHAEMTAIIKSEKSLKGCRAYVTHASCDNCFKHMILAGIKEVIYDKLSTNSNFVDEEKREAVIRMMKATGVINRNINGISYIDDKAE